MNAAPEPLYVRRRHVLLPLGHQGLGIGVVFTALALATTASAVAAVPALLRGRMVGWAATVLWLSCYTYWSVYRVFAEAESEAVAFLVVAVGILGWLSAPSVRSFAGVHR